MKSSANIVFTKITATTKPTIDKFAVLYSQPKKPLPYLTPPYQADCSRKTQKGFLAPKTFRNFSFLVIFLVEEGVSPNRAVKTIFSKGYLFVKIHGLSEFLISKAHGKLNLF